MISNRHWLHVFGSWLGLLTLLLAVSAALLVLPVNASTEVPIAQSVEIVGGVPPAGSVIRYNEDNEQFTPASTVHDAAVYGVVGERPAIVFVTATNTVPVITSGVTMVRVHERGGDITRGDLLTSAGIEGLAMRADISAPAVFAIALQAVSFTNGQSEAIVLAETGVKRAESYQAAKQAELAAMTAEKDDDTNEVGWLRPLVAGLLVFGGLGFLLYSFRSILATGMQSVGRNPRARRTVVVSAVLSLLLLVVVTVLVLLAAIGVLVLPV